MNNLRDYNLAVILIFAVIDLWLVQHLINCEQFSIFLKIFAVLLN